MKHDFNNHNWMLAQLQQAQEADKDRRDMARAAHDFLDAPDGQWEPDIANLYSREKKPRYTFDMTSAIVDQIVGHVDSRDYDIVVRPAGGDASKETAKTFDGLVRNIENISDADQIYAMSGREMVTGGLDGWRVKQRFVNDNSFDQDLVIDSVGNFLDRVWFGPHQKPDASDAKFCWILSGLTPEEYDEAYPDKPRADVSSDRDGHTYFHRTDLVMVGEFIYLKPEKRELVLMSDGQVHVVDDKFQQVADELYMQGIVPVDKRSRTVHVVHSRIFNASDWLTESRETVFQNWLPVIPCYANFKYYEDKCIWYGAVEKLQDAQRVYNYGKSRQIEEGALSPRELYWLTPAQAEGYEEDLAKLNVTTEPYMLFNPDPLSPGIPQRSHPAQVNPGLQTMTEDMKLIINQSAGLYGPNMGENPFEQSGRAIEALQDRGDTGNNKYVRAMEIAQRHTGRILVNAIPRVYTQGRQVRLLREDGGFELTTIGRRVQDQQTGQWITLDNLEAGVYDCICESGPSFKSRQNQTVSVLKEIGTVDPSVIEISKDVLISNITAPGMDQVARRVRQQLFQAGVIPEEDMTDEEKAKLQAMQQQPPQEDAMMVAARAEEAKAQADLISSQTEQFKAQADAQQKAQKLAIEEYEAQTRRLDVEVRAQEVGANIEVKQVQASKLSAETQGKHIDNMKSALGVN